MTYLDPAIFQELAKLWNLAAGLTHPLTPHLLQDTMSGDLDFHPDDLIIERFAGEPCGFVLTKRPQQATFPGCEPYQDKGYICLLASDPARQRLGIGRQLLTKAEDHLRATGAKYAILGGSFHHVVPGIPSGLSRAQIFFRQAGYTFGKAVWDLAHYTTDDFTLGEFAMAIFRSSGIVPRIIRSKFGQSEDPAATEALSTFLYREFPGRWCHEVPQALSAAQLSTQVLGLLYGKEVVGFAQLHLPGSFATRRWHGFNPFVAAIGPLGVARALRGRELGLALVAAATGYLQQQGAWQIVIDWTDLLKFYGKLDYRPWLKYFLAQKTL
ncbi:MAG: GNAT family N-acetyltransferase [Cyanobacteria bacterium NC_groundwater_1444_Ag_S-0.65um_54_12]|nr:GNAT family N-acetyltransferase [Cyanobacteria bacterium NC_groundwater_1444_Ag_S-0.65um_54_12]